MIMYERFFDDMIMYERFFDDMIMYEWFDDMIMYERDQEGPVKSVVQSLWPTHQGIKQDIFP